MSGSVTKAAFSALRWNYVGFVARSGSNFLIGVLLARLLGPKPFGQLAAAALVIGVANVLADAGFTSAIIQAPSLTDLQIRYVFTLQFLIAVVMTLACCAASGQVASTFHDPAIRSVVLGIAPVFVLQAFGQTANALLRRELAFRAVQTAQLVSYFVGYLAVGIPLAFLGAGVWSLVSAQLVQATVCSALFYRRFRHPLTPTLDSAGAVLLRFGAKVTASNVINYGISNADNFVVGHAFGSLNLGFYSRAFSLANAPADGIIGTVQQVLFASCSRAEGRLQPIRRAYLACLSAVALVVLPAFWAMAVAPTTIVIGLYGERWRAAAPLFQPLVLALSIHALMAMAGPILGSLDMVQREVHVQAMVLVAAIAGFWAAGRVSVLALAWTVCGIYVFRFFAMTSPTVRVLSLSWREIVRVLAGPALVGLLTAAAVRLAVAAITGWRIPTAPSVALLMLTGGVTAALVLLLAGRWLLPVELIDLLHKGPLTRMAPPLARMLLGPSPVAQAAVEDAQPQAVPDTLAAKRKAQVLL